MYDRIHINLWFCEFFLVTLGYFGLMPFFVNHLGSSMHVCGLTCSTNSHTKYLKAFLPSPGQPSLWVEHGPWPRALNVTTLHYTSPHHTAVQQTRVEHLAEHRRPGAPSFLFRPQPGLRVRRTPHLCREEKWKLHTILYQDWISLN